MVLHVLAPAPHGGLEEVVTMLSHRRNEGPAHVAAIVTPSQKGQHPFVQRLRALGVDVTLIEVQGRDYLGEYRQLKALMRALHPAVVHTHGYRPDIVAGLAARHLGLGHVSTVHGFTGGGARNRLYERLQLRALRKADAIVAVSRPLVARLVSSGVDPETIHFLQNAFVRRSDPLPRDEARRALGLPLAGLVAGWIGRLSSEKGVDIAVQAIAHAEPEWTLSIVGSGPQLAAATAQVKHLDVESRVRFHGSVENAGSLLSAFDAFVLSSRTEGTPVVLLEAMSAGVPIIAANVGGVPDVVTMREAILVPPENSRAIARALDMIRYDPASAATRTGAAKSRVIGDFSGDAWIASHEHIYRGTSLEAQPIEF